MASVKNTMVKSGNVSIPVRIYRPRASGPLPTIVYYHGGAWFVGGVEGSDLSSRQLANDANAIVVSVEYRMAPENPYPASWDDDESDFERSEEHTSELQSLMRISHAVFCFYTKTTQQNTSEHN